MLEAEKLTTHDIIFLSELAGDHTTYSGGWGAWMTACAEWAVGHGYARRGYHITDKGVGLLEEFSKP